MYVTLSRAHYVFKFTLKIMLTFLLAAVFIPFVYFGFK